MPGSARARLAFLAVVVAASTAVPRATAVVACTWIGGGADGNWSTAANWDNCAGNHAVPIDSDRLIFPDSAGQKTNTNDIAGLDLFSLEFDGYNYTIGGNAITLSNGVTSNLLSGLPGSSAPFFDPNITLMAPQTFTALGVQGVFLRGTLNLNGFTLTVTGVAPTGLVGNVIGAGGITTSSQELFLFGAASTYTGVTTVNAGNVQVGSSNALGASGSGNGTVVAAGARVLLDSDVATTIGESFTFGANATVQQNSLQSQTLTGPITLAGDLNVVNDYATVVSLTGLIAGPFGVTRTGLGGSVVLSGPNTYTGTTTVMQSTLLVNGSQPGSAVSVAGGTLGGTGTIGSLSSSSGSIAPGASPGILNTGAVTWNGATTFAVELNGTTAGAGYDQVNVTGPVSLGSATLTASVGFVPSAGSTFTIINNDGVDPIVGTFAGLPQGAQFVSGPVSFTISYVGGTGNDVVLTATTVVPTMPWPWWILTAALVLLLAATRVRRQSTGS